MRIEDCSQELQGSPKVSAIPDGKDHDSHFHAAVDSTVDLLVEDSDSRS